MLAILEYLKYLREESNVAPRIGAIAVGGLSGYILALRRGIFRKLIYTSIGAGGMAALCYPREAKEYSHEALQLLKRYIIIGYHFINGGESLIILSFRSALIIIFYNGTRGH